MSRNTVNDVFTVNENVQTGKYCSRHHSKSHIELPCGDTYCMYCLKDEVQRYTWMMLTCKHCQKEISKEQIAIFLQKEVFQENPFKLTLNHHPSKNCSVHKHDLIQFELPCGQTVCIRCLYQRKKYAFKTYGEGPDVRVCGCGEYLQLRHIEYCISQCEQKALFQENPFKLVSNRHSLKYCSIHKHDLIQFELPCDQTGCIRCLYEFKTYTFKPSNEASDASVCSCGGYLRLRHIEECISQCEQKAVFQENPFKLASNHDPQKYCFVHKHDLIQFELPCDQTGCIRCLYEFKTYTFKPSNEASDASVCSCGGYLRLRHIEECISQCEQKAADLRVFSPTKDNNGFSIHPDSETAAVLRHTWTYINDDGSCPKHNHSKVCLKLSCGKTFCHQCIQTSVRILESPLRREKQDHIICNCSVGRILKSEITSWIENLPKSITEARILQRFNQNKECPEHHMAICARLPCDVLLCRQCIVKLKEEAKIRHTREPINRKQPYAADCTGCSDKIPGEVLESFLKEGLQDFQRHNRKCWCRKHKHHKIVVTTLKNDLLCKLCLELAVESNFSLDGESWSIEDSAKLFEDAPHDELFSTVKEKRPCDCGTWQAQAKLPCGLLVCHHCVYKLDQKHRKTGGCLCPKCSEVIAAQSLQMFLEKYDDSECYVNTTSRKGNCHEHRHWKVFCESKLLADESCTKPLCLMCIWKNKKLSELPSNVPHFLRKVDLQMKDLHEAPKCNSTKQICQRHKHHKVVCKAPCGEKYCIRCFEELLLSKVTEQVRVAHFNTECVECRTCTDVIPLEVLKTTIATFIEGDNVEIKITEKCKCSDPKEAASLPCGATLCKNCFEKPQCTETLNVLGNKCVLCPDRNCNDVIPIQTLESHFSKREQELIPKYRSWNPSKWCRTHQHHKICITDDKDASLCKLCLVSILKISAVKYIILDGEKTPADAINTLIKDISEIEMFLEPDWKNIPCSCKLSPAHFRLPCGLYMCDRCLFSLGQNNKENEVDCPKCREKIPHAYLQHKMENTDASALSHPGIEHGKHCKRHKHWKACLQSDSKQPYCLMCIDFNRMKKGPSILTIENNKNIEKVLMYYTTLSVPNRPTACKKHKHHKVVCSFPCGPFCLRCIEYMASQSTTDVQIENESIACVKCTSCRDMIPVAFLDYIQQKHAKGKDIEIIPETHSRCKCGKESFLLTLPCGTSHCEDCFVRARKKGTVFTLQSECIQCPNTKCDDVVPITALKYHFSGNEKSGFETGTRRGTSGYKKVKSKTMFMKFICGHFICVECQSPYDNCSGNKHEVNDAEFLEAYHDFGGTGANDSEGAACSRMDVVTCYMCTKKGSLVSKLNKIYYERPVPGSPRPSDLGALPNIGFTCYANSIFQILNQTPELADCLKQVNRTMPKKSLSALLLKILEGITHNRVHAQIERIGELMRRVMEIDDSFRLYHQNDCHSFLMCLLNALKDTQTDKRGCVAAPSSLFEGRMCNAFRYKPCNHSDGGTIEDSQIFFSLVIPVPQQVKERWTIEKGLAKMMEEELFDKNVLSCRQCETTGKGSKDTCTSKTLDIVKAPKRLMLHIGRFKQDEDYFQGRIYRKNNDPVVFKEILLLPVVENGKERKKSYELYGIVLHMGGLEGGHYYSMVKKKGTTQWYTCSDSSIYSTKLEDIFHDYSEVYSKAYLLFYKEI
ncbi:uncharacterized protein LOC110458707 isoform X2 [Mizuhopecten yessoensis]|uniref:uncharacterized protein LOC110458707 isoform X2 n=1 Tax=Mizuhopecten yessoensis TaxID=6573 RepID=UPI000B4572A7|nr:uncharacterized protein LOC110458707 isoform X2 [Mizuhopecten yessoensis]